MNELLENIGNPNLWNRLKSQTHSARLRPAELPQDGQVWPERRWWRATYEAIKEVVKGYPGNHEVRCWRVTQEEMRGGRRLHRVHERR